MLINRFRGLAVDCISQRQPQLSELFLHSTPTHRLIKRERASGRQKGLGRGRRCRGVFVAYAHKMCSRTRSGNSAPI